MKKFLYSIILAMTALTGCTSLKQKHDVVYMYTVNRECDKAEIYARANFSSPVLYGVLAALENDCRGNKRAAIEYAKQCVAGGYAQCNELLQKLR